MTTRSISGLRRVPYKIGADADPVAVMFLAWQDVLGEAEPHGLEAVGYLDVDMASHLLHTVTTRILAEDATLSPEYRFATVEVDGYWVDGEGETTEIVGMRAATGGLL